MTTRAIDDDFLASMNAQDWMTADLIAGLMEVEWKRRGFWPTPCMPDSLGFTYFFLTAFMDGGVVEERPGSVAGKEYISEYRLTAEGERLREAILA